MDNDEYEQSPGFELNGPGSFEDDVRRVWRNAIEYNGADTMWGIIARLLQDTFERRLQQARNAPLAVASSPAPEREGFPALDAKLEFYERVAQLPPSEANAVLAVIEERCPAAISMAAGEARVDLDAVDEAAFSAARDKLASVCPNREGLLTVLE